MGPNPGSRRRYIPPPPPPPSPPPCSGSFPVFSGGGVAFCASAGRALPWHPASANTTKSPAIQLCQVIACAGSALDSEAPAQACRSFDHLVGPGEDGQRDRKAERFGGLEVDHQ